MSSMTEVQNKNSDSLAISGEKGSPSKGDGDQDDLKGCHSGAQKAGSDKIGSSEGKYYYS